MFNKCQQQANQLQLKRHICSVSSHLSVLLIQGKTMQCPQYFWLQGLPQSNWPISFSLDFLLFKFDSRQAIHHASIQPGAQVTKYRAAIFMSSVDEQHLTSSNPASLNIKTAPTRATAAQISAELFKLHGHISHLLLDDMQPPRPSALTPHLSHGASLQSQSLKVMVQLVHGPHLQTERAVRHEKNDDLFSHTRPKYKHKLNFN